LAIVRRVLLVWGSRHGDGDAPCAFIEEMAAHREQILTEVRRRWEQRDLTPLLPWLSGSSAKVARPRAKRKT